MKYGRQHPTFHPSPFPFISMDNEAFTFLPNHLIIFPWPFFLRVFYHAWDYKLVSYKHAYHSWRAVSHFSTSSKCFICEEDMHANRWALSWTKKPNFKKKNEKWNKIEMQKQCWHCQVSWKVWNVTLTPLNTMQALCD